MNIDKWLDNRLHPGHHFNSQILYDFNKEVNKEWIEAIKECGNPVSYYGSEPTAYIVRLDTLKSKMGVSDELGK